MSSICWLLIMCKCCWKYFAILAAAILCKSANSRCHFPGGETPAVQAASRGNSETVSCGSSTVATKTVFLPLKQYFCHWNSISNCLAVLWPLKLCALHTALRPSKTVLGAGKRCGTESSDKSPVKSASSRYAYLLFITLCSVAHQLLYWFFLCHLNCSSSHWNVSMDHACLSI